jgi:DNA polymerase-3 subunit epsilon
MQLAREVRRIEWRRTCGELGALLLESRLVKDLLPVFNRQLRRASDLCGFVLLPQGLRLARGEEIDADTVGELHGVFRTRRAALEALRGIADENGLCLQALGIERAKAGGGACFRHQIRRCAGLCAGKDSAAAHQGRLVAALARLKRVAWPWRGPIGVIEHDRERDATDVHVIHHWCWLGTAKDDAEVADLLQGARKPRFDLDQYRILSRHLAGTRADGRARVVELG